MYPVIYVMMKLCVVDVKLQLRLVTVTRHLALWYKLRDGYAGRLTTNMVQYKHNCDCVFNLAGERLAAGVSIFNNGYCVRDVFTNKSGTRLCVLKHGYKLVILWTMGSSVIQEAKGRIIGNDDYDADCKGLEV